MSYKRYNTEQILSKLDEAEKMKGQGFGTTQICIELNITQATYYSWKKKYKRIMNLENSKMMALRKENENLRKAIISLVIENVHLRSESGINNKSMK